MLSSTSGSIKSSLHYYYSPSSFSHCPPTSINHGSKDNIPLNYQYPHRTCPSNYPIAHLMASSTNCPIETGHGLHCSPPNSIILPKGRSGKDNMVKKIYTAQGLRDRRVRLSKEVAHKFFHLQDTLGFDKASKTLEWLLGNSGQAIEELGRKKMTPTHEEEKQYSSLLVVGDEKKRKVSERVVDINKESRAKARARARERTRAKIMSKRDAIRLGGDSCGLLPFHGHLLKQPGRSAKDGQNPFKVVEAHEVEEPRSEPLFARD